MRLLVFAALAFPVASAAQRTRLDCESPRNQDTTECRAVEYFSRYLLERVPEEAERGTRRTQASRGVRMWLEELTTHSPRWFEYLPDCPVCVERVRGRTGEWNRDIGDFLASYHSDAAACYRSASYRSSRSGPFRDMRHRQQCCYDEEGDLLRLGNSRGTPDLHDTALTFGEGHLTLDVLAFHLLQPAEYFRFWKPNEGEDAVRSAATVRILYLARVPRDPIGGGMAVRRGETVHVSAWGSRSLRLLESRRGYDVTATPEGAPNPIGAVPELACPWLSVVGVVFDARPPHEQLEHHCIGAGSEVTIGHDGQFGILINPATHTHEGRRITQDYTVRSQTDIWVSIRRVLR
jgi:hypothetical protein